VRDLILGVRILDGKGADLRFGGQVMKNVAGFDVSRLMAGAMGTLGVILEVSLKTLPLPATEITLHQQRGEADAIRLMNEWAGQPLPISATAWCGGDLGIRLSGAASAMEAARKKLGGDAVDPAQGAKFWQGIRDHTDPFFVHNDSLWRLSVKSTVPAIILPGVQLIEWNGALRWLRSGASAEEVRNAATNAGGHAMLFRHAGGACADGVFHPLSPALAAIHCNLKKTFDPSGILNPGRLYPGM
jgi:glycolate oxidase FAD binding subunit